MKNILSTLALMAAITIGANAGDQYYPTTSGGKSCGTSHCGSSCGGKTFYIFGFGGGSFSNDFDGEVAEPGLPLDFDLDNGWTAGGGIGWRIDGGYRFEIEGFYGESDFGPNGAILANVPRDTTGSTNQAGFHVNFIKEFGNGGGITPYIGAGIGYTNVTSDNVVYGPILVDDSDGALSWQAIAGLEFCIGEKAGLYIEYNYHSIGDISLSRGPGGSGTTFNVEDLNNHTIQGGIRFYF